MRELTEQEQTIKKLCQEKYGAHAQDEVFFLESGEAMFQAWGTDGNGPWVHLTNLGAWLAEGVLTKDEIKDIQM